MDDDQGVKPGKESIEQKNLEKNASEAGGESSAADALRQEYMNGQKPDSDPRAREKAPEAQNLDGKTTGAQSPGSGAANSRNERNEQIKLTPNQRRQADEALFFQDLYHQQNLELEPLQKGWGPYQSLEKMVRDQKIQLSEEELLQEAKRIRDRDFSDLGRNYYKSNDSIKFWSEAEINQRVIESVSRIKGIDVSAHQGDIDWPKVKEAGYQFAFLKATEGGDWVDKKFEQNRQGARDAGLKVGYYHFFRPPRPVEDQIDNFAKTVGKAEGDSLRLVIDTEDDRLWKPYSIDERIKMIEAWCKGVEERLGTTPQITIYGSPNFFNEILNNDPRLAKYSLWIAHYKNVAEPSIPKPWSKWDFWQYTDKGKVPGISSSGVDLNMFHGSDLTQTPKLESRHKR